MMDARGLDDATRERFRALHSALIADSLDRMGVVVQAMRPNVRPMYPNARIVGRALPVLQTAVYRRPDEPYEILFEAFRALRPNDVFVITTTGHYESGVWGGLLSTSAQAHGVVGCVIDGLTRDVHEMEEIGFPVFAVGRSAVDSEGRCEGIEWGKPVDCAGARVEYGDIIVADDMGVVVVPGQAASEVLERAEDKQRGESNVREILATGADVGEVFKEHGIL